MKHATNEARVKLETMMYNTEASDVLWPCWADLVQLKQVTQTTDDVVSWIG